MKYFKVLLLTSLVVLHTTCINANTINMAPIITYLLSDTELQGEITINDPALKKAIASIYDDTPYSPAIDIQGVIDAGGLTVTVPYTVTSAPVTLEAYSTSVILDAAVTQDDEAGIVVTFAWTEQTNLPVGSGTFTATITIDDSGASIPDNTYNAKKLDIEDNSAGLMVATFPYVTDDAGGTGGLTLKIYPGIPDRMFGLLDNTGDNTTHEFLYIPVTNAITGMTWLNNNLGANYANINSPAFNITQQATASNDHNAYGSLFQWGRKADGHELINWTDGATGTAVNGTTDVNSDDPTHALFITESESPVDWRVTQDGTLWAKEGSTNNVCPIGYRIPTGEELDLERLLWGTNDAAGALGSALVLPMAGFRMYVPGEVYFEGEYGYYWGSTLSGSGTKTRGLTFYGISAYMSNRERANGYSVRCIKAAEAPTPLPANLTIDNAALQKVIVSIFDNTPYNPAIDIQGVIDAGGVTVFVPYTLVNAPVTLPAYSTSVTLGSLATQEGEAGIVATFAWIEKSNLSVGSRSFVATLTIDDSAGNADDIYNAKKLDIEDNSAGLVAATFPYATDDAGGTGVLTLKIMPGIADRMFGQADNNGDNTTHMFLYVPVTNLTTGITWLSNNLGANYANVNSPALDITQQATASNDHNAYGSLFQWGRKADGHELINWTDGATGTAVNGTTITLSDDPTDALFIRKSYDWRVTQDDTLWASEFSTNNVCPAGYRVPTGEELDLERLLWGTNDAEGALTSELVLTRAGYRYFSDGTVAGEGANGRYWGSTVSDTRAQSLYFSSSDADIYTNQGRANGFTVRCIKD